MIRRAFVSLLLVTAATQQTGIPHGGGTCQSDEDCSLGGTCTEGKCACDLWFTGATCAFLNLQRPDNDQQGTCGDNFDSYYSWGGRSVYADGKYHLYASFMCNHHSLRNWTTVSASAHFVANTPDGQYEWADEDCSADGICTPIVQPWSHNTYIVQNIASQSPQLLLWHIGNGVAPPSEWYPCFNKSQVGPATPQWEEIDQASGSALGVSAGFPSAVSSSPPSPNNTAYVQTADSVDGPWTAFNGNNGVSIDFTGAWTQSMVGNPAPFIFENGTTIMYFTGRPCPPGSGNLAVNCIAMAIGDSWQGPFTMQGAKQPITYPESEDPFVFRDPRGNFHLLTNVNTFHARCAAGVPCGGHAWSRDGLTWSNLTIGAFGPVITFTNGTVWTNAYVERPLVTFNPDGTPLAFHVGMGRSTYLESCNWVQLFCAPGAQNCGPTFPPADSADYRPAFT